MILGFSKKFPNGESTFFQEKIEYTLGISDISCDGKKYHTIRSGNRWREGMKIHYATGVRSKRYNCFAEGVVKLVQTIHIVPPGCSVMGYISVDGRKLNGKERHELIWRDGLSFDQFTKWFDKPFKGQIIHWTDLKY